MGLLRYFIARALRNMRQSPLLSSATILTVTLSLSILAVFSHLLLNLQQLGAVWSGEVQLVAYLDAPPEGDALRRLLEQVKGFPEVERLEYVSRELAFERFGERLGANSDLLEGISAEILPASVELTLFSDFRQREGIEQVAGRLGQLPAVSDIHYGQQWLEKLESALELTRMAGLTLGGFLLFAALFIVSNTIRLTLYARRDEIEIMALVGGTPFFIKAPYLFEGALQGVIGGALALGGATLFHRLLLSQGVEQMLLSVGRAELLFLPPAGRIALLVGGGLLGLFGSAVSLRRFVRF